MTTDQAAPALDAAQIVSGLRATLRTGRTKPAKWRLSQLHALVKLVEENEEDIYSALDSDLHKPKHESFMMEVTLLPKPSIAFSPAVQPSSFNMVLILYT